MWPCAQTGSKQAVTSKNGSPSAYLVPKSHWKTKGSNTRIIKGAAQQNELASLSLIPYVGIVVVVIVEGNAVGIYRYVQYQHR